MRGSGVRLKGVAWGRLGWFGWKVSLNDEG